MTGDLGGFGAVRQHRRVLAVLTVVALGGFVFTMLRRERAVAGLGPTRAERP